MNEPVAAPAVADGTPVRGHPMSPAMAEATRLTREGRLAEAVAVVQRTLRGGQAAPGVPAGPSGARGPVAAIGHADAEAAAAAKAPSAEARGRSVPPLEPAPSLRVPGLRGPAGRRPARRPTSVDVAGPGRWIAGTHAGAAGARDYKLYVPSGYRGQAMPLVVMLHGCTQGPDDFAAGTGMNGVAEAEGFLVAYPAQAPSANASKCWNWFDAGHQRRERGEPALIAGITRQVLAEHHGDPGHVYVAGLSAGGAMAAILAATHPDLYAAVGVHSGLAPGSARDLPSAFQAMRQGSDGGRGRLGRVPPLIVFHGDADPTVHPSNADDLVQQWAVAADEAGGGGAGCRSPGGDVAPEAVERGQAAGGRAYTREIYRDDHGRAVVERWTVHGAGHAWSGGSRRGSYADPAGPDASREMARFFREHGGGSAASPPRAQ